MTKKPIYTELDVAKLERAAAEENAAAKLELGQSSAKVAALKVAAGLTPLKAALIEKDTRIGVAREIAKSKFPDTMIKSWGKKVKAMGGSDADIAKLLQIFQSGIKEDIEKALRRLNGNVR